MPTRMASANKASKSKSSIHSNNRGQIPIIVWRKTSLAHFIFGLRWNAIWLVLALLATTLLGCASAPPATTAPAETAQPAATPTIAATSSEVIVQAQSRWVPVDWSDLPGFDNDDLSAAWNAWLRSCERPGPIWAALCAQIRPLALANSDQQRDWIKRHLRPYRVESLHGASSTGLLTGYYEPLLHASRQPSARHTVPLYSPPAGLRPGQPWHTRQEMDTSAQAQAALAGQAIAWLEDPLDALALHIQGSGRVRITEPDGSERLVRLAYAASNEQPYRSVGQWLRQQGLVTDASWPGIRAWAARNPQRVQEMLWSNPRVVFFREEPLSDLDARFGPRGAQGVALTPERSIAVDPRSVPYGTPVWLVSHGPMQSLQRLVLAQDTGSAIVGAVRADYFTGWGEQAAQLAGSLRQNLRLWVLWPAGAAR